MDSATSKLWLKLLEGDLSHSERREIEHHLGDRDACSIFLALGFDEGVEGRSTWHGGSLPGPARAGQTGDRPRPRRDPVAPPSIPGLVDLELVRHGGMGVVFRAREVNLDRPVAVKVLSAASRLGPSMRLRAIRESLLMASLRHPNVVQVYRSGEVDGLPYLMMEWIAGGTLRDRIKVGLLSPREAAATVRHLAAAVAEAHSFQIIHRDLKPDNVMLVPAPGAEPGFIPKLTDFGLARRSDGEALTEPGLVCGTPGYMAPEQTGVAREAGELGPATDIHGLGAILHSALTGRAPYAGGTSWDKLVRTAQGLRPSIRSLRAGIPVDLATIVEKCLHVEVARRYRSAAELADDLGRFLDGRPILARPTSAPRRLLKWARRRPALAALAALLALALAGGAAGMAYHVASIGRAFRSLAAQQVRTARALAAANEARDRAQLALAALSDADIQRVVARGRALDDADRAFLRRIRASYLEWPLEPDPVAALRFRGDSLGRLGDIFEQVDQYDDAQACREGAIAAYDEAIRRASAPPTVVDARIQAMNRLHYLLNKSGQHRPAEALARRLIEAHEALAANDEKYLRDLGLDYIRLGTSLGNQQRHPEADAAFDAGLARLEQLRSRWPGHLDVATAELKALYNAADTSRRPVRVEALSRKLLARAEAALAAFPGDREILQYRALVLFNLAAIMADARPGEALATNRRMMDLIRSAVAARPDDMSLRHDFITGAAQACHLQVRLRRPADADPELQRAIDLATATVEAEPAVFDHAYALVEALVADAARSEAACLPRRAIERFDRVATVLAPWTKLQGRASEVIPRLLDGHRRAAGLLAGLGDHADAARHLAAVVDLCPPEERPRARLQLAAALGAAGRTGEARAAAEQARAGATMAEAERFLKSLAAEPDDGP